MQNLIPKQRGDTLIEVMFAITVFSFVVVGALSLMNQGSSAAQRSLEITLVRQEMDAQAEALRFMHGAYTASYQSGVEPNLSDAVTSPAEEFYRVVQRAKAYPVTSASELGVNDGKTCQTPPSGNFILNPREARFEINRYAPAETFAQLEYDGSGTFLRSSGLWIEALRVAPLASDPNQSGVGYIDFHIRACWSAPGLSAPVNLGKIVRLYEPRA